MHRRTLPLLLLAAGLPGVLAPVATAEETIEGYSPSELVADPSLLVEICAGLQAAAATALQPPDPAEAAQLPAGESEEDTALRAAPFDLVAYCAQPVVKVAVAAVTAGAGPEGVLASIPRPSATPVAATRAQTVRSILATGRVATGSTVVTAPATIKREVWLTVRSSDGRRTVKRLLVAKVTRTVAQRSTVELTARLTTSGRRALRAATGAVRLTLKTTTRPRRAGSSRTAPLPVTTQLTVKAG